MKKLYSIILTCMSMICFGQTEDLDKFQRVEGLLYDVTYTDGNQYISSSFSGGERRIFASGSTSFSVTVSFLADRVVYKSGYFYLLGTYSGTVDFDLESISTNEITAASGTDYFIAKYTYADDPQLQWVISYDDLELYDLKLDASDHVHLIGKYSGTVDANSGAGISNLTSTDESYAIVELDDTGAYVSAFSFGENNNLDASTSGKPHFDVDASGNYYIGGSFDSGTVTFDGSNSITEQHAGGVFEGFIAKYNNSGAFQWVDHQPSSNDNSSVTISDVEIEGSTILYSGLFSANVNFVGLGDISASTTSNTFVANINSSGTHTAVYEIENPNSSGTYMKGISKLEIDKLGNYWILTDGGSGLSLRFARLSSSGTVEFYGSTGTTGAQSFTFSISDRILVGQSAIEGSTQYFRLHHFTGYCFTDPIINSLSGNTTLGPGQTTGLSVDGELNSASSWEWFTGSCSGTSIGTGAAINSGTITGTTTFYVKAANSGCSEVCQSITITYDDIAPAISSYSPTQGATDVPVDADISFTFNESVATLSSTKYIKLYKAGGQLVQQFLESSPNGSFTNSGQTITINPSNDLETSTSYYVLVEDGLFSDVNLNEFSGISSPSFWTFTTEEDFSDNTPPNIDSFSPADDATNVPTSTSNFTLTFDEPIQLASSPGVGGIDYFLEFKNGSTVLKSFDLNSSDATVSGSTITLNNLPTLEAGTSYHIRYWTFTTQPIEDLAGNKLASFNNTTTWNFTVISSSGDIDPPLVQTVVPADDAIDVPLDQTFSVTFDENIVLESGQFIVNLYKNNLLFSQFSEGNANISLSGSTLNFTLPGLENETDYSIQLLNIQDAASNEVSPTNQADWSFITEPEKPSVTTFLPVNGATDVLPRVGELVMNMSEDVLAGTGELRLRSVGSNTTIKTFQMGTSDVEISGSTVTLKNVPLLGYGSSYWIQNFNFNDDAISDLDGNTLEHWNTDATWSFTVREMIEWNGSSWVGGVLPGESDGASITGNYNTATDGALNITDLTISGGGIHVAFVADGNTVTEISGNLSVIGSGSLTVESGASLIILGTHSGNDITTKRNVTGNAGLSMVGSPILSMDIGNQGADYTYKYNDVTQAWETVGLEIMQPGEGYFIGYNDPSPTLELTGVPHTGDVTVSIPAGGYKLVANPYLAPIDNDGLFTAEQGVTTGAVWLWDDGGFNDGANRGGDYITISQAGTASGGSGASGNTYEGFYPSFQAFFVQGDADGGDLTFTPSMMVTSEGINADDHHFRKAEMEKIKLSLSNGEVFNELIVAFREDATEGQDFGLDAPKLEGATGLSFSSHFNNEHFAILGLPFPKGELSIPLELKVTEHGNYQLDVSEVIGLLDRYTISLRNNSTQRSIELGDGASLNLNLSAGTNSHFVLILSPQVVTGLADGLADLKILGWSTDHLDIYTMEARSRVSIFDLTGKSIYTAEHLSTTGEIRLQTSLESGKTYVLRVNDQSIKFILK